MAHSILRWVLAGVALLIVGPIVSWITGFAPAIEGGGSATPLLSSSLVVGVLVWLVGCAIAGVYGVLVASLTTWRLGVCCIGLALVWSAWGTPRLDELVRTQGVTDPSVAMAIDGLLVGLFACAFAWVAARRFERPDSVEPGPQSQLAIGILGCAVVALVAAWLVARDERAGQAIGAAVVAGFAGGAAGRGFAPKVASCWLVAGIPIAAVSAPIIGGVMTSGAIDEATYAGSVSPLLRVMPADWVVGALIGFPAGTAQASAMSEKTHHHADARAGSPAS